MPWGKGGRQALRQGCGYGGPGTRLRKDAHVRALRPGIQTFSSSLSLSIVVSCDDSPWRMTFWNSLSGCKLYSWLRLGRAAPYRRSVILCLSGRQVSSPNAIRRYTLRIGVTHPSGHAFALTSHAPPIRFKLRRLALTAPWSEPRRRPSSQPPGRLGLYPAQPSR
jgi:hypothetical protein